MEVKLFISFFGNGFNFNYNLGGNWEFQWYTNNRSNSFVEDGILYLKPTMTAETIGDEAMKNGGKVNLFSGSPSEDCTDNSNYGKV